MAQSAQERFNGVINEVSATRQSIKEFQDAAFARFGSYSYGAGYLESSLIDAIMLLPKHKRAEFRQMFLQQAEQQKKMVDNPAV